MSKIGALRQASLDLLQEHVASPNCDRPVASTSACTTCNRAHAYEPARRARGHRGIGHRHVRADLISLSDSELNAADLLPARPAVTHRYPMRDLAQVRRSLALADRDRRCGEISELCYRQLRSKLNARLAELSQLESRALEHEEEPRESRSQRSM
jgi:hypothetical protein